MAKPEDWFRQELTISVHLIIHKNIFESTVDTIHFITVTPLHEKPLCILAEFPFKEKSERSPDEQRGKGITFV